MKVVGFCGLSGVGKTTLIERLIPLLKQAGQRVSVIKLAHKTFDIDQPGKDSFRHRAAGEFEVLRSGFCSPALYPDDPFVVALAVDDPATLPQPTQRPEFGLNDVEFLAHHPFVSAGRHEYQGGPHG